MLPCKSVFPKFGSLSGSLFKTQAFVGSINRIDPRFKISRREVGKSEAEISHIAFWIDDDSRDVVNCRLFDQTDPKSGFSAAGHTDNGSMCCQVFTFKKGQCICFGILSKIEESQLFIQFLHPRLQNVFFPDFETYLTG